MLLRNYLGPELPARVLGVMRIAIALVYWEFGTAKLFGFPHVANFDRIGPFSLEWFSGTIELAAGGLLVLGLFTPCAAFVASGEMAFAYFISHAPRGFFPILNGGSLAATFCFAFLYLSVAGGGPWSLDALRARHRRSAT